MVEKKYIRTALTMAALASYNAAVEAQDNLGRESGQVCGFTVRATAFENQNVGYIDNDIAAVDTPQPGLFYISNDGGRLYNPRGDRCSFDPYLDCDSDSEPDTNRSPFTIQPNGTLAFQGQSQFYLCSRGAFQRCDSTGDADDCTDTDTDTDTDLNLDDLGDNPRVYPPVGTTSNRQRDFQNCTVTELVASQCFGDDTAGTFVPPASALQSSTVPAQTGGVGNGNGNNVARLAVRNGVGRNEARQGLVGGVVGLMVLAVVTGVSWLV